MIREMLKKLGVGKKNQSEQDLYTEAKIMEAILFPQTADAITMQKLNHALVSIQRDNWEKSAPFMLHEKSQLENWTF